MNTNTLTAPQKCVLIITDGIGHKPPSPYNAFANATKPTYDWLFENVPYSLIHTYGGSVGLPHGQMGNSEVGHTSIGSGRVLYQDLVRISKAIEDGSLSKNTLLQEHARESSEVHLLGLMSDGGVHSHLEHFLAMANIYAGLDKRVWLHLITDGRDVLPTSALGYLEQVQNLCDSCESVRIGSVSGRYYAMDRDKRWERVEEAYRVLAYGVSDLPAKNQREDSSITPKEYIENSYKQGITDEFIKPKAFNGFGGFAPQDGLVMINFRSDRAREIIEVLGSDSFGEFEREKWFGKGIASPAKHILTMTQYDETFPYPILFPKITPQNTLAEVLSSEGKTQVHIAETEKYAHVTFFFNGGIEEPFLGESRVLIPSPKVATYDLQPQMSAPEVGAAVCEAIKSGSDFVVVNFANGDMVGHTGKYQAALKAVEAVDKELGAIYEVAKKEGYAVILTSDHGNCEEMQNDKGEIKTNHTVGDVYCFILANGVKSVGEGALNNIAPTVLKIMGIEIPKEMDSPLI